MKKLITFILTTCAVSVFAQGNLHEAKIIGSVTIGNKEVTSILDEFTGCSHKSTLHTKNLFVAGEQVKIDMNKMKVIKPNLPENVFVDRCKDGDNKDNQDPYSPNNYMDSYGAIIREAIIETNNMNKVHMIDKEDFTKEQLWKDNYLLLVTEKFNNIPQQNISSYILGNFGTTLFNTYVDNIKVDNRTAIISISKEYENIVLSSSSLTKDEQTILLALISQVKHITSTVMEESVWANGEQPDDDIITSTPFCDRFNNCMLGRVKGGPFTNLAWVFTGEIFLDTGDCIGSAAGWW